VGGGGKKSNAAKGEKSLARENWGLCPSRREEKGPEGVSKQKTRRNHETGIWELGKATMTNGGSWGKVKRVRKRNVGKKSIPEGERPGNVAKKTDSNGKLSPVSSVFEKKKKKRPKPTSKTGKLEGGGG